MVGKHPVVRRAGDAFETNERNNFIALWSELAEFLLPNQSGIFYNGTYAPSTLSTGTKKTRRVYDSSAIQANHDLGSSIHSTVTNPQIKWSRIRYADESLNNDQAAVMWLEMVNNIIHKTLSESNFDTEVAKNYISYPALGTMVLFHEPINDGTLQFGGHRFKAIHLSMVAFETLNDGTVSHIYVRDEMSAEEMVQRYKNVPKNIVEMAEKRPTEKVLFTHAVVPRAGKVDKGLGARPTERPFASYIFENQSGQILEESGYYEMPYYVVRWSVLPGECYGRSPGHIALPDVRTYNKLVKCHLQGVATDVNKPVLTDRDNIVSTLNLSPSKINVVNDIDRIRPWDSGSNHQLAEFMSQKYEDKINRTFFLDKLMLPPRTETGEMTAFEVSQRLQQMQKVLGSVLGRLNNEFLSPLVVRTFKMLLRGGALPDLPPILQERPLDVDIQFINGLAQAQQLEDVNNIQQWVNSVSLLGQVKPQVLDYIDEDGIAKHLAKVMFVPEIAIRNDQEVQALREGRQQQLEIQQALGAAQQASEVVKNLPDNQ